jgi:hypothetical protein
VEAFKCGIARARASSISHPALARATGLVELPIDLNVAAVDLIDHRLQLELAAWEKSLYPRVH